MGWVYFSACMCVLGAGLFVACVGWEGLRIAARKPYALPAFIACHYSCLSHCLMRCRDVMRAGMRPECSANAMRANSRTNSSLASDNRRYRKRERGQSGRIEMHLNCSRVDHEKAPNLRENDLEE